jgi:hypothetical protein
MRRSVIAAISYVPGRVVDASGLGAVERGMCAEIGRCTSCAGERLCTNPWRGALVCCCRGRVEWLVPWLK